MQLIPQGLWWAARLVWGQAGCGSALQTLFHGEQGCRAGGGGGVYPFGESPALPPAPCPLPPAPCRAHHCLGPREGGKAGGGLGFPGSVFRYKCLSHPQGTWYSRCPRTLVGPSLVQVAPTGPMRTGHCLSPVPRFLGGGLGTCRMAAWTWGTNVHVTFCMRGSRYSGKASWRRRSCGSLG